MPVVYVCPLSQIHATVASTGARRLITLIDRGTPVPRPDAIAADAHLFLGVNDIVEVQDGLIAPAEEHVEQLLAFVGDWDRRDPIVVHCFAGISRSTAAAFITVCVTQPRRGEAEIAQRLRRASRFATPNALLVAIADDILGRNGRMVDAITAIGRGEMATESVPFALPLEEHA